MKKLMILILALSAQSAVAAGLHCDIGPSRLTEYLNVYYGKSGSAVAVYRLGSSQTVFSGGLAQDASGAIILKDHEQQNALLTINTSLASPKNCTRVRCDQPIVITAQLEYGQQTLEFSHCHETF